MELDMIKLMVVVLTTFLVNASTAPTNTTISDYLYCNETSSTSNSSTNNGLLQILYDELDKTLDVLGQVCLNYDEIVRL